ncbi:hypothetical protein [Holdemanella porci]|uniref:hypothetical protein n=1 Tax=Holdemanella porci TaxID=2652276 RepID=UPI0040263898
MEKEKAEIANLVARYDRVQSLMKYVNNDTLKESYKKQPKGKAVGVDGGNQGAIWRKHRRKY